MSAVLALLVLFAVAPQGRPAPRVLDDFEQLADWMPVTPEGVHLTIGVDRGRRGRSMRLDFSFSMGSGFAIARRALPITLPANYAFSFWIRGEAAPNTLEFKLLDGTGENVWWYTERDVVFDGGWHQVTIRRRQITFAWGPLGGGELQQAAWLELVITSGRGGGSGSVWFDDLVLTPLPVYGPYDLTPEVTGSTSAPGHEARAALDGDTMTSWRSAGRRATFAVDFLRAREFGGLTLVWESGAAVRSYVVLGSMDGRRWRELTRVQEGNGGRDHLYLPDSEARFLRLVFGAGEGRFVGIRELRLEPLEWAASRNAFFEGVARDARRGLYPRGIAGERATWTVVGVDRAPEEALLSADGALEGAQGLFSIEPFLRIGHRLLTWADVERDAWLEREALPIPSVRWHAAGVELVVSAFATGPDTASSVVARYRLRSTADTAQRVTLYLAVRPFQVNPPPQSLGVPGGVGRIGSLTWDGRALHVNGDRVVVALSEPEGFGATVFEGGEIAEHLERGALPSRRAVRDPFGAASAALAFPVALAAGDSVDVHVEIPLVAGRRALLADSSADAVGRARARAIEAWDSAVDRVTISLPAAGHRVAESIRSTLAYILVNRDRAALQPGSRSYERSWIRDGSLTSAALLRFGHTEEVRRFVAWYAGFQYPNGKVPCCVDARGGDPVPEHDSHGEFVYLVAEYYRYTGDRGFAGRYWPNVLGAVRYLDSLRQSRRTAEYSAGDQQRFFGLLPPSISHEGYAAKPMHSYWDDFFALRGLKDATMLAEALGDEVQAARLGAMRDEFARELYASLDRTMAYHRIDYLPGSADLGDFDATSTTIALAPGGELARLPRVPLERTFERYWQNAARRMDGTLQWQAYTPYELRTVGALVRLGWKDRALALLDRFLADQAPPAWNQWPEIVWRDRQAPKFIGDLPHTWVGSDFLRSVADLFAWERESDSALVIGSGLSEVWLADEGVAVRGLGTWWGPLTFSARAEGSRVVVRIADGVRVPPGGLVICSPRVAPLQRAVVNGVAAIPDGTGAVTVRTVPAEIIFEY